MSRWADGPLEIPSSPAIMRGNVDLPQPDGPTGTTYSPWGHLHADPTYDLHSPISHLQIPDLNLSHLTPRAQLAKTVTDANGAVHHVNILTF